MHSMGLNLQNMNSMQLNILRHDSTIMPNCKIYFTINLIQLCNISERQTRGKINRYWQRIGNINKHRKLIMYNTDLIKTEVNSDSLEGCAVFNTSWYLLLSLLSSINENNLVSFTIIIRELNRVRHVWINQRSNQKP
jgi:hypothetical protein